MFIDSVACMLAILLFESVLEVLWRHQLNSDVLDLQISSLLGS